MNLEFQGKFAYGYKTKPFGATEFLLVLKGKRKQRVRGERLYKTDVREKSTRAQRISEKGESNEVFEGNMFNIKLNGLLYVLSYLTVIWDLVPLIYLFLYCSFSHSALFSVMYLTLIKSQLQFHNLIFKSAFQSTDLAPKNILTQFLFQFTGHLVPNINHFCYYLFYTRISSIMEELFHPIQRNYLEKTT